MLHQTFKTIKNFFKIKLLFLRKLKYPLTLYKHPMSYSAGLLNVGTLNATGASAQLTANDATVTNLTVNGSVNASNLEFVNLDISGNLTANIAS